MNNYLIIAEKLKQYKTKTITLEELPENDYETITCLVSDGLLIAVKASGTNGNLKKPLYNKYKIITENKDFSDIISDIKKLHPKLISGGYLLNKPEDYIKYKNEIELLNIYLFTHNLTGIAVSRKERSFEIFNEEKLLGTFMAFLEKLGINSEVLNFYDTPEYCFADYISTRKSDMTLLICENKDIWFNIRRIMFEESHFTLFGVTFDGTVYGAGNAVTEKNRLAEYTRFLRTKTVRYYYWGDIDRAGFDIYLRLQPSVTLLCVAYSEMLQLAQGRIIPESDDNRTLNINFDDIYKLFDGFEQNSLKTYITQNKRIPQEIINYAYLFEHMR